MSFQDCAESYRGSSAGVQTQVLCIDDPHPLMGSNDPLVLGKDIPSSHVKVETEHPSSSQSHSHDLQKV